MSKQIIGKLAALFLIMLIGPVVCGQRQWTYDFNNGLNPIENGGIALKPLGTPGQIVKEKIPGSDDLSRSTYVFEKNSGLQFNNAEANGFLNKSFTIEIYFKLSELDSWKRVLDFKNRKSDYGSYIYEGKLNFYDFAISEKAPVRADRYVHYVYSRDFETKVIKMYINGQSKLEFKDPGVEGVLDSDQVLNFFQDDLVANHESSAGTIVLIRLYDRVMTPVFIRSSYHTIARSYDQKDTENEEVASSKTAIPESPAKKPNLSHVTGKVYDGKNLKPVDGADVLVRKSVNDSLVARTKTVDGVYEFDLAPFESYRISAQADGFESKSIPVKTSGRQQEIKSLISLNQESYAAPMVTFYFKQGTDELEGSEAEIDSVVSYFQRRKDLKLVLKGHTDNTGDFEKNIELSNMRVNALKAKLLQKGLSPDRMDGRGLGPAQPNRRNQSEASKQSNRRVEVWAEPIKR